jgi:hypothetical protein
MDNVQIRRKILKLLYDAKIGNVSGALAPEELMREIGLPMYDIQINLSALAKKGYVELSETVIGIRIYKFAKMTIEGIDLFEDISAFNRQFPLKLEQQEEAIAYNLVALRALLTNAFSDSDLRDFCYDRPLFRPAYEQFGDRMGKKEKVSCLIEYAETQDLFVELLAAIKEENPRQYAKYEAQLPYTTKMD